ncbi:lysoplasmalogenase [Pedobacter polaris]|uniref:Lysoplasmalogenase n=1 Tax=Pedobacter polaris TaxID=2571273 RepID=A0A4U1CV79_9SPHI|nr:lysoplasmalogenase [Pedobacter polaris]TKC10079.1 lysoplasmalogenase [Pedobacter polaris]
MLKKHLEFSFAFIIIFVIQLLAESDQKTTHLVLGEFKYILKPSITISLMIFYAYQTQLRGRFAKRIFMGLLFGLVGDSLLMFVDVNSSFFMFGLIAFLLGHLMYIFAFYLDYKWNPQIEKSATRIALAVFGAFCLGFYLYLRPYLDSMKIPVMIYAFVISLMAIMAVNRKGRVSTLSFNLIFIGAILFLISDSFLAYNKFVKPFEGAGVVIMATYMLAQYLITVGSVERKLKKSIAINPRD